MTKVAPIRRAYHRHDNAECGHGTCAATVDCTGECAMKALPVIDEKFLDEQLAEFEDDYQSNAFGVAAIAGTVAGIMILVTFFAIYMATK